MEPTSGGLRILSYGFRIALKNLKKMMLWMVALAALSGSALRAQAQAVEHAAVPAVAQAAADDTKVDPRDLTGTWQGTLQTDKTLRIVIKMSKTNGGWQTGMYSIDEGPGARGNGMTTLQGSTVKYLIPANGGVYEGKLSADGTSIAGTWTMNAKPLALTLIRVTDAAAWEIPAPPAPPKLMAADANPSFEVATIKPNPSGAPAMQGLNVNGRNFTTRNSSLGDLIAFAYDVEAKQIVNGPEWMNKDRYDIAAVPDQEGIPNANQLRTMMRKLLADRFKLAFHHEKRELSAFVLTVGKNGQKLTPTQLNGPLPGLGFGPAKGGMMLGVRNGTLTDFTSFLQMLVLDRPVVDQTGITGKFDFQFTFTPDDSLFHGHPPPLPPQTDSSVDPAAGFFTAIQEQLGLKLDAMKTPVDVIAIDHVEKPSAN
jgi:uncharacterized protein (TIGR03435 family)